MSEAKNHVKTGEVRFSFPHLFEPASFGNDDKNPKKYSITILIDKTDKKTLNAIKSAYAAAKQDGIERFGKGFASKASPLIRPIGSNYGLLHDCDEDEEQASDPNYAGHYTMNVKSTRKPQVLARETGKRILEKEDGEDIIYPGCYGKVTFNVYPYSNAGYTGISAGLGNVLKTRDGERFGGFKSGLDDFADDFDDDAFDDDLL